MPSLTPATVPGETQVQGGGARRRVTVKKMKKVLKKAGLKTTGKRSTLTRRIKKAHLKMRGGDVDPEAKKEVEKVNENIDASGDEDVTGGRRRSRKGSRKH
jgi:hypothetical protein